MGAPDALHARRCASAETLVEDALGYAGRHGVRLAVVEGQVREGLAEFERRHPVVERAGELRRQLGLIPPDALGPQVILSRLASKLGEFAGLAPHLFTSQETYVNQG